MERPSDEQGVDGWAAEHATRRRFLAGSVAVGGSLALGGLLAACGDDDSGDSTSSSGSGGGGGGGQAEAPTVRMLGLETGMSRMILEAIKANKLDEKNGFKGEFTFLDPSSSTQAFLQGEADISLEQDLFTVAIARQEGQDLVGFNKLQTNNGSITVKADSDYRSPKQLVGKKVGQFGTDSGTTSALTLVLQQLYDINLLEDYDLVQASPEALPELLKQGEVEAILDFTPWTEKAIVDSGGRVLFVAEQANKEGGVAPGLINATAREGWLRDNEEGARAFIAAAAAAYKLFTDSNYELLAQDPYREALQQDSDAVINEVVRRGSEIPLLYDPNAWTDKDVDDAYKLYDQMVKQDILIKEVPPKGAITTLDDFYAA